MSLTRPDILFIMTDQRRFDTIAALGNSDIYTPNMDRLARRGISFSNAYALVGFASRRGTRSVQDANR
jgi:choline-sulfatase